MRAIRVINPPVPYVGQHLNSKTGVMTVKSHTPPEFQVPTAAKLVVISGHLPVSRFLYRYASKGFRISNSNAKLET